LKRAMPPDALQEYIIAPITGARIETVPVLVSVRVVEPSPPSRGRGLKQGADMTIRRMKPIAPITGARIETREAQETVDAQL